LARRKGRIKDKWRDKRWVTAHAPNSFNNVPIAYVPITDDESAVGRVLEVTLYDILKGDPSQHQYKIYFQINKVDGDKASTIFKRYEYSKEFLRSLVRRGSSKINFIIDIKTKDGYIFRIKLLALTHYIFRIKLLALTHRQLNTSRQHALRLIARDVINKTIPEMTIDQFVQATCYSKINSDIMAAFKKVIRVRHVGLEKVKLIRTADKETKLLEA
jgi:small subunit ribosomal protein S3Ae